MRDSKAEISATEIAAKTAADWLSSYIGLLSSSGTAVYARSPSASRVIREQSSLQCYGVKTHAVD